tara:strand:+ start:1461 stop:2027 length:567 start_codon:yes stop_codon:yes gene_type:complete
MGGGVSKNSNNICPEDICLDDFEKIKKIFKQLEKNKHSQLENLELEQISAIHIKNEIKKLKNEIKQIEFENKKFILEKNLESIIKKNKIEELKEKSIQDKVLESEKKKKLKENEIIKLQKLSKKEKKALFKRRVSIEGAYDFELFCNYMKTQTHEIHNIRFVTPNGKLNELRLQVRSPNSHPKKKLDW